MSKTRSVNVSFYLNGVACSATVVGVLGGKGLVREKACRLDGFARLATLLHNASLPEIVVYRFSNHRWYGFQFRSCAPTYCRVFSAIQAYVDLIVHRLFV